MTTAPQWSSVDDETADLLTLVATGSVVTESDVEWDLYVDLLRRLGDSDDAWPVPGTIDPNDLRAAIAGRIKPQRIGAFTHRALSLGLVEYTGQWVTSTDTHGRNSGKPARELRWIGGAA